jgi:hypothetical protein
MASSLILAVGKEAFGVAVSAEGKEATGLDVINTSPFRRNINIKIRIYYESSKIPFNPDRKR